MMMMMISFTSTRTSLLGCIIIFLFISSGEELYTAAQTTTSAGNCTAANDKFFCNSSNQCIASSLRCNYKNDCTGAEDEAGCEEWVHAVSAHTACSANADKFLCQSDNQCIDKAWVCDSQIDCKDAADEQHCNNQDCDTENKFRCLNGMCINKDWMCDGHADCPDASDENNSTCQLHSVSCGTHKFLCPGQSVYAAMCISSAWRCDGDSDCQGGEDEKNCNQPSTCDPLQFMCDADTEADMKCIPKRWRCDGDTDCKGGQDEKDCGATVSASFGNQLCAPGLEFKCKSGRVGCILLSWHCDGESDCSDGSDEDSLSCPVTKIKCSPGQFACADQRRCIPLMLLCSGQPECEDSSDELSSMCLTGSSREHKFCVPGSEFSCQPATNTECLPMSQVCDGARHCSNGNDESSDLCGPSHAMCSSQPCTGPNVTCKEVTTPNRHRNVDFLCVCDSGFEPADRFSCHDVDECSLPRPACDQICHNTHGSFTCHCVPGYELAKNLRSCLATGPEPARLLFNHRQDIRSLQLHAGSPAVYMPLTDSKASTAIDIDVKSRTIFYSDMAEQKIYKFLLPNEDMETLPQVTDLNIEDIKTPDGIAYDWINDNLYWTDTAMDRINVAAISRNATHSTVLYSNLQPNCADPAVHASASGLTEVCIDEPRAIAVYPQKGWLFWTDWGHTPHIARAGLDGSFSEQLVHNTAERTLLIWPNGLALDLSVPLAERLYWIDAKLFSLYSCLLESCMVDNRLIYYSRENIRHPFSITVFEDRVYWSDWSKAAILSTNKHNGSDVTVLKSGLEDPMDLKVFHPAVQKKVASPCPAGYGTCEHICVPRPWMTLGSPPRASAPSGAPYRCLCQTGYELNSDLKTCARVAMRHSSTSPYPSANSPVKSAPVLIPNQQLGTGALAGIVVGSVVGFLLLCFVAIYIVYRKLRGRRAKILNFDNPVYKRTTEDKMELPNNEYQPARELPAAMVPLTSADAHSYDYDA